MVEQIGTDGQVTETQVHELSLDSLIGDDPRMQAAFERAERRLQWHRRWGKAAAIGTGVVLSVVIGAVCWLIGAGWVF
jgi:hypothetical protein